MLWIREIAGLCVAIPLTPYCIYRSVVAVMTVQFGERTYNEIEGTRAVYVPLQTEETKHLKHCELLFFGSATFLFGIYLSSWGLYLFAYFAVCLLTGLGFFLWDFWKASKSDYGTYTLGGD